MNNKHTSMRRALFAATFMLQISLVAQEAPWVTVDSHQPFDGQTTQSANGAEIAVSPFSGQVFAAGGVGLDKEGDFLGTLRASAPGGNEWTTLDSYRKEGWTWSMFRGVAADSIGRVFTAGETSDSATRQQAWFVREWTEGAQQWVIADWVHVSGLMGQSCADVKIATASGDVYAAGHTTTGTVRSWTVRKRAFGQAGFATVDSLPGLAAASIAFRGTTVFVAGQLATSGNTSGWTIRMSPTGAPGSWRTVDSFSEQGNPAAALGIAVAADGWIYATGWADRVVGKGRNATKVRSWTVRRSGDGGTSWTTVDRFGAWPSGSDVRANAAVVDSVDGAIFVAGTTPDGAFVRKGITGANGAITWTISDDFQDRQPLLTGSRLNGIAIDQATREIYSIGGANDGIGPSGGGWGHWMSHKLSR